MNRYTGLLFIIASLCVYKFNCEDDPILEHEKSCSNFTIDTYNRWLDTNHQGHEDLADNPDPQGKSCSNYTLTLFMRWEEFKQKFERNYSSPEEDKLRFGYFLGNVQHIDHQNRLYAAHKSTWEAGINQFADQGDKDRHGGCALLPGSSGSSGGAPVAGCG